MKRVSIAMFLRDAGAPEDEFIGLQTGVVVNVLGELTIEAIGKFDAGEPCTIRICVPYEDVARLVLARELRGLDQAPAPAGE